MKKKNICVLIILLIPFLVYGQLENIKSTLEIYDIEKNTRTKFYEEKDHFEAPNWSKDGSYLLLNSKGKLFKLDIADKKKTFINTGFANKVNNDHGISPDGTQLVISHNDDSDTSNKDFGNSRIYLLPIEGGEPKTITTKVPSYWHGWSPDGKKLIYTAHRNGDFDIYSIGVEGGEETRLTTEKGLDDGSEFSYNGEYIYYNSMKSGKMEIWKMKIDGSQKEQITNDRYSNWFPHPSPDGKYIVYLAYLEDQGSNHPAMKEVALKLLDLKTGSIKTLCTFLGGQGTINVPSWSPDSKKFAFVSYISLDK